MTGSSRFVTFGADGEHGHADEGISGSDASSLPSGPLDPIAWVECAPSKSSNRRNFLAPALAALALAVWTGLFVWANFAALAAAQTPAQWLGWIEAWSSPAALVGIVWLLTRRQRPNEAERFSDNAGLLADEAGLIEERLARVNAELSIAREFLAAQSRDLESLGRQAGERLSQHADRLALLIRDNGVQLDAIGTVSSAALDNMERLRAQLPVLASAAKDVTNNIGNTGLVAQTQLSELVSGMERLDALGAAGEERITALRDLLQSHEAEALSALRQRGETLRQELSETRERLDAEEAEAITSLRARLSGLREEVGTISRSLRDTESVAMDRAQAQLAALTAQAATIEQELHERGARVGAELIERQTQLLDQIARLRGQYAETTEGLEALEARAVALTGATEQSREALESRFAALAQHLSSGQQHFAETEARLSTLTDSSVRLHELIQAAASHSRETLPAAIGESEARLGSVETRVSALRDTLGEASTRGEDLSHHAQSATDALRDSMSEITAFHTGLDERSRNHAALLDGMRQSVSALDAESTALARKAEAELATAIAKLQAAAAATATVLREEGVQAVTDMAQRLGSESGAAIARAMRTEAAALTGQLEQAAAHAAGVGREAAAQLRDQIVKVESLIGTLEARVGETRTRAQEQVDNGFARRAALITEALNSSAIEIAKALDTQVADTAWAGYLKGDRGIFTRQAVRLLDAGESKAVARLYRNDDEFRDRVSHYIHDFEGMLRQILATRDGEALGVTLLSSDMGKLYVALAQAIERLRS